MRKVEVYRHGLPAMLLLLLASLLASLVAVLVPVTTPATADSEPRYGKARWAYYVPYAANSFASLQQHIGDLDYLSPYWYQVDERGNILPLGGDAGDTHKLEIMRLAQDHGVKLVPMVKNRATYEDFHPVLADRNVRRHSINELVRLAETNGYDGMHIDYEALSAEDRPYLTTYMTELAAQLRHSGRLVTQAVPAKDRERTTGWSGAYDYTALGNANDLLVVMAYGYGTGSPQSTAPYPWVVRCLNYASSQIAPHKLLLGLAWYGYDWNLTQGGVTPLRFDDAVRIAARHGAQLAYDETVKSAYFTYTSAENHEREVWFEDARSNSDKLDLVFRYGLAGAAGWRMGHEDSAVWPLFDDRLAYRTWYLAAGATTNAFDTWILIQNPNPEPVDVLVTFMDENGLASEYRYHVKEASRFSIYTNQLMPNSAFATKVEASAPVFVERAMYFGYDGHDSAGVNAPSRQWFLPDGSSQDGTDTWVLIMNPNPETVTARLSFFTYAGLAATQEIMVNPTSRLSVHANQYLPRSLFSVAVHADKPIVAERASYIENGKYGHGSSGSPLTAQRWYAAEGFTGHKVAVSVMNPNPAPALATLTFMLEDGSNVRQTLSLVANSRQTFIANDVLPPATAFSTRVEADQPVVVERTSYVGQGIAGNSAQSSLAASATATTWFLPEGSAGSPFQTFVLLQNPNELSALVTVTFMTAGGSNVEQQHVLQGRSRFTIPANNVVPGAAFSVRVDSTQPIVVERSMYFGRGAHDSMGIAQ